MSRELAERVQVLRDEVLDTARLEDGEPPGAEVFDAVIRFLETAGESQQALDLTLHDSISRRLAWGEAEHAVLADITAVCKRLLHAAQRSFRSAADEVLVATTAAEVACSASRIVAMASLGRAGRERSAQMREELAQSRLKQALERQQEEMGRLKEALGADF